MRSPKQLGGPERPFACSVKHLDVVQTPLVITLRAHEIRVSRGVVDAATGSEALLGRSIGITPEDLEGLRTALWDVAPAGFEPATHGLGNRLKGSGVSRQAPDCSWNRVRRVMRWQDVVRIVAHRMATNELLVRPVWIDA